MKRFETSIDIKATAERVWTVLTDVENMPRWTASMTSVELFPAGSLAMGSRATVRQPRLGTTRYVVTEYEPPRSFSWTSHRAGITTTGLHMIEPTRDGVTVTLAVEHRGPLAALAAAMTAGLTRRYIGMEASGLKQAGEA